MKRFLAQIALGIGLLVGWAVVNDALLQPMVIKQSLAGMGQIETVILGDSHGKRIWLNNSINFGENGDPPMVQYKTLLTCRPWLPNTKQIFISVGPQNFNSVALNRLQVNHLNYLTSKSKKLASASSLFSQAPSRLYKIYQLIGELYLPSPLPFRMNPIDEFDIPNDLSDERTTRRLTMHNVLKDDWFVTSIASTKPLSQLTTDIQLDPNCQLWLVGTPLHPNYTSQVGHKGWREYKEYLTSLSKEESVTYVSLEESVLPDSFYLDADHLNTHGMRWLTDTLYSIIQETNG